MFVSGVKKKQQGSPDLFPPSNTKRRRRRRRWVRWLATTSKCLCLCFSLAAVVWFLVGGIFGFPGPPLDPLTTDMLTTMRIPATKTNARAERSTIAYGTRGHALDTHLYVQQAIDAGFRQIVTSGYHRKHYEAGVGVGWTHANNTASTISTHVTHTTTHTSSTPSIPIRRSDLYLQTMFVPHAVVDYQNYNDTDPFQQIPSPHVAGDNTNTIEEQVERSIQQSLLNLKTDYLDAVLYHQQQNRLQPYEDMLRAWRVLEGDVMDGTIRHLGMSNCHDPDYLRRLVKQDAKVKPTIVQNRFHRNRGLDVSMWAVWDELQVEQRQCFWVLTGNRFAWLQNAEWIQLAESKQLTGAQLMFAFLLSLGLTPLMGPHQLQHMQDDLDIANMYIQKPNIVFTDMDGADTERHILANILGMPTHCMKSPQSCVKQ
uniref:NADP-dependent oxidoreductase domain-containing protein n=1 Tax=Attheya septentrionalis TaxID=420275 RepID=A0A7S2UFQ8_9STRA|mmetsp:Transcript_20827/g.37626  ORF Transcript_20827/g.37626 Transcript_20827/m.37626 type:complete len:427 (+) Transcript_20827:163-1443(+)